GPFPFTTCQNSSQFISPQSKCCVFSFHFSLSSGIFIPKTFTCSAHISTKFCRSSSFVFLFIFHFMLCSLLVLSLSCGPNIMSDGHHQRSIASWHIAFCSSLPLLNTNRISNPCR